MLNGDIMHTFSINVFLFYSTWLQTGWSGDWILVGTRQFSFSKTSTSSGDQPASSVGASFLSQGKAARARVNHSPPSYCLSQGMELYLCLPCMPSDFELDSSTFIVLSFFLFTFTACGLFTFFLFYFKASVKCNDNIEVPEQCSEFKPYMNRKTGL